MNFSKFQFLKKLNQPRPICLLAGVLLFHYCYQPFLVSGQKNLTPTDNALVHLNNADPSIQNKGLQTILKIAAKGEPKALLIVADLHFEGRFLKKDHNKTYELTKKAAEIKFPEAQNNLGFLYKSGIGTAKNNRLAIELFKESASAGFPPAIYNVGICYEEGVGTKENLIEAVNYFRKAANLGHVQSKIHLGNLYHKNDPTESLYWYRLAADKGNPEGMYNVANAHLKGRGAIFDYSVSFEYFSKAAQKDHLESTFIIGKMLIEGLGVQRNIPKGLELIKKARLKGLPEANQFNLDEIQIDFDLLNSINNASKGEEDAMIDLGWKYFSGSNVGVNKIESYAWFSLAAEKSQNPKHLWSKSFVAKHLSLDDLITAKKRSKQISLIYRFKKPSELDKPPPHE